MKKHWEPLVKEDKVEIFEYNNISISYKYYNRKKSKQTILFLYGFGGNMVMIDMLAPHLSDEYNLLTLDYPGHGYSPKVDRLSLDILPEVIIKLLDFLKEKNIILACYSFGGLIGLKVYELYKKKIKNFILLHTTSNFCHDVLKKNIYKIMGKLLKFNYKFTIHNICIPLLKDRYFTKELYALAKDVAMYNYPVNVIQLFYDLIFRNLDNLLVLIDCPTLLIGSSIDILVSKNETIRMSKLIKNSRIKIFPQYGHFSIVSKPEELAIVVKTFLNSDSAIQVSCKSVEEKLINNEVKKNTQKVKPKIRKNKK